MMKALGLEVVPQLVDNMFELVTAMPRALNRVGNESWWNRGVFVAVDVGDSMAESSPSLSTHVSCKN